MTVQEEPKIAAPAKFSGEAIRLRLVVFICGASVMALEMVGVRLLEPHLGSTHYVWGAIIGIFLGALSLGYYVGGRLSDKMPRMAALGYIIVAAAAWIFLIPFVSVDVGIWLAHAESLNSQSRALIGALLLYGVPSVLLGMVSPFAVRLAASTIKGMGSVAGGLYALGTLGSIIGTFMVSFVLTEWVGSRNITWGIAATLVLMALLCFWGRVKVGSVTATALALMMAVLGYASLGWAQVQVNQNSLMLPAGENGKASDGGEPDKHLVTEESVYHQIAVIESRRNLATRSTMNNGQWARYMKFNNQYESGALVDAEGKLVEPITTTCGYVRNLHLGVIFTGHAPKRLLMIGGGGGVGSQNFEHDYAGEIERIDVVDIDPVVLELAAKYFNHPPVGDTSRTIRSHAADGRLFLTRVKEPYDYIVLDAYTSGGRIPRHLISHEFFELVNEKLTDDGVLVCNIISALKGKDSRVLRATYKTVADIFPQVYVFPRHENPTSAQNVYLVATKSEKRLTPAEIDTLFLRERDKLIKQPQLRDIVKRVLPYAPADLDGVPMLTDDYCPTDSMVVD